jgi:dTDP-4-amino-4,6-dideoxygalactose transaminase
MTPSAAPRHIPLLNLKAQHEPIREEILQAITQVVDSQRFILGPDIAELEREVAAYCGARHGIACASGSDALYLALSALEIGPGDQVLTTPYTFFATAGAICAVGAEPVYADIDPLTFNMDAALAEAALEKHPRIRAIIPVHLFGGCADMDELNGLAAAYGIPVIEDAAQAIGAEHKGSRAGSLGRMACFSFFPSKNLGAMGDAGMITTNDSVLSEKLAALRVHGSRERYRHEWIGVNSRLDSIQAAVLRVKLKYLDSWTEGRIANARIYGECLSRHSVDIIPPAVAAYQTRHVFNQYTIRAPRRDALRAYLQQHGIGSEVYYPIPLHLQPCFAKFGGKPGDFPVTERLAQEALSLPVQAELTPDEIAYVSTTIARFYA